MLQPNYKTVNKALIPNHIDARKATKTMATAIWEATKSLGLEPAQDYWVNSTPIAGIREIRIRVFFSTENTWQIMNLVESHYAKYKSKMPIPTNKMYRFSNHRGNWVAIKQYFKSWQPGEKRIIQQCEPGNELTIPTGSRVEISTADYFDNETNQWVYSWLKTGTVIRRHTYSQRVPYYIVRCDEPNWHGNEPYPEQAYLSYLPGSFVRLLAK